MYSVCTMYLWASVFVSSHYVSLTASVFFNGAGTIVQVYFWAVGPVGLLTAQAHPKTAWGGFREDQGHRHRPERDRPMKTPKWPVKVRDQEIYTQQNMTVNIENNLSWVHRDMDELLFLSEPHSKELEV